MPRNSADARTTALDKALRGLFRSMETRPIPSHLRSIVDQLDQGPEPQLKKRA
jgi:hypothetical protein